jgi:general secretion pathway protein H
MDVENKISCSGPLDLRVQRRCAGFTLIEMMVVIFIIGIVASFATLTVGQSQTRILQDEMKRLQSLLTLGSDEAVLQTEEFALEVYRNGYRFMHLEQAQQQWEWQPVQGNAIFRARCFPDGVELAAEIEGTPAVLERLDCAAESAKADQEKVKEESSATNKSSTPEDLPPRIFLLSSGEMTPFELTVSLPDKTNSRLVGELTGKLTLPAPGDDKKHS